ncbi:MAG TPA: hypothetical protein VFV85_02335 [Conexibacter sp.]|nr:hypothetical protein [Conexibacter sp.]
MSTRHVVLTVAIVFIGFFTFLTVHAALDEGVTVGTVISLGVLLLFAVGILGALASGPDDHDRG